MKLIRNLLIWQKLVLGFAIVGVLSLGIVIIYHNTLRKVGDNYQEVIAEDVAMLRMAADLSRLLARMRQTDSAFHARPGGELLEQHQALFSLFMADLERLRMLDEQAGHAEDLEAADAMAKHITTYRRAFLAVAEAWQVKGFDGSQGLQGNFLQEARHFESIFNDLDVENLYLSLLRQIDFIKAFHLSGKRKYINKFAIEYDIFMEELAASRLQLSEKQRVREMADTLRASIAGLAEDYRAIGEAFNPLMAYVKRHRVRNIWEDYYQVRNHENLYLRTGDRSHAALLSTLIDRMQAALDQSAIPDDVAVVVSLESYRRNFLALVEQDGIIVQRQREMEEDVAAIETRMAEYILRVDKDMEESIQRTRDTVAKRSRVALFMSWGLVLLLAGVAFALVRILVRPIASVSEAMKHIAHGDLTLQVPVHGEDELGQMARIFNGMTDELRRVHDGLQTEKGKLTTILLSAREGIVVTDSDNRIVLVNPAAERLLESTQDDLMQAGFDNLLEDPDYVRAFLATGGVGMPDTLVYKGRVLSFYAATVMDKDDSPIGSAALIRDVTEEKRLEEKLRNMSYTDKLTGLYNRRRMEELLAAEFGRAVRYGRDLSILFFDVDHFKKFNDTYGHDMGDRVLQTIGALTRSHFRQIDHCCRYGGEEFCIILPDTNNDGAFLAADRFRERLEQTQVDDGIRVTTSVGVATIPKDYSENWEVFLKAADTALYGAKRAGRNRVMVWQEGMTV